MPSKKFWQSLALGVGVAVVVALIMGGFDVLSNTYAVIPLACGFGAFWWFYHRKPKAPAP